MRPSAGGGSGPSSPRSPQSEGAGNGTPHGGASAGGAAGYGRTARNSSTGSPQPGPKPGRPIGARQPAAKVGDLLEGVLAAAGIGKTNNKLEELERAWREAVGRETASRTRVQGVKSGQLVVLVTSSALAQELSVYLKRDLIGRLREQAKVTITDLRCKVVGTLDGTPVESARTAADGPSSGAPPTPPKRSDRR